MNNEFNYQLERRGGLLSIGGDAKFLRSREIKASKNRFLTTIAVSFAVSVCLFAFAAAAAAQKLNPTLDSSIVKSTDLIVKSVSRVQGKTELIITLANTSMFEAKNVKITFYALPYGFYADPYDLSGDPYLGLLHNEEKKLRGKTPLQIIQSWDKNLTFVEQFKTFGSLNPAYLKLAWAKAEVTTDIPGSAKREVTLESPKQYILPAAAKSQIFYPTPFVENNGLYLYAPVSVATFDLGVYYVVAERSGNKNNKNSVFLFDSPAPPLK